MFLNDVIGVFKMFLLFNIIKILIFLNMFLNVEEIFFKMLS